MKPYEVYHRRLESIRDEAKVIILRVDELLNRTIGHAPEYATDQIDEGAKQIQLDVCALIVHRVDREKENAKR